MKPSEREPRVQLAATLAPLSDPEAGLAWISANGYAAVQLSAAQAGMRPRELDSGARRALRERLRKLELAVAGVDLWVPPAHFESEREVGRAVDAFQQALEFCEFLGRPALSCILPARDTAAAVRVALLGEADRRGVPLADFAAGAVVEGPAGIGIDTASVLERDGHLAEALARAGPHLVALRLGWPLPAGGRAPFSAEGDGLAVLVELRRTLPMGAFRGFPVADARPWPDPRAGLLATAEAWRAAAAVQENAR